MIEKFSKDMITKDMIKAAKKVFKNMAIVKTIRPIVIGYQKKVLKENNFKISKKWCGKRGLDQIKIIDPNKAYLMSNNNHRKYVKLLNIERKKAGLKVKDPSHCPLLVAENNLRSAEHDLIKAMKPLTDIDVHTLICSKDGLENYKKYIDLNLRLLAPFCEK